jgi:hypothetical protein
MGSIALLRLVDGSAQAESVEPAIVRQVQSCLAEIGASFADIFGPERVLWVEGQTEEECFPLIVHTLLRRSLLGTIVRGVVSTGELESKRTRRVFEIYDKLSKAAAIFPVAVGFIFDDELRPPAVKTEMAKWAPGRVHFLGRRMYENYLLGAQAIAFVLSEVDAGAPGGYSQADIQNWLDTVGHSVDYGVPPPFDPTRPWLAYADGAKLLSELFSTMSQTRVSFDKRIHSTMLTRRILETVPELLQEIADLLRTALEGDSPKMRSAVTHARSPNTASTS